MYALLWIVGIIAFYTVAFFATVLGKDRRY